REVKLAELRAAEGVPTEVAFKGRSRGRRAISNRIGPRRATGKVARQKVETRVVSFERSVVIGKRVPEVWLVGPVVRHRVAVKVALLLRTRVRAVRSPGEPAVDSKDAVKLPATQDVSHEAPLAVQPGQLPHKAAGEPVPDVKDRVAVVETRQRLVHREAFGRSVGSRRAAMPGRALIE